MKEHGIYGLMHVGMPVADLERTKRFYQDVLGFYVEHENSLPGDDGDTKVAFLRLGDLSIEAYQQPKPELWRKDGKVDHIAMRVKGIEDVVEDLKKKGVEFEMEVFTAESFWQNGCKWITFRGPDGEHLELTEIL